MDVSKLSRICRWGRWALVAMLLVLHAALALTSSLQKSETADEQIHLSAGYSYWLTHDYRLDAECGPDCA
jgi:hypothetical protein